MIVGCVAAQLSRKWIESTYFKAVIVVLQNISAGASQSGETYGCQWEGGHRRELLLVMKGKLWFGGSME